MAATQEQRNELALAAEEVVASAAQLTGRTGSSSKPRPLMSPDAAMVECPRWFSRLILP